MAEENQDYLTAPIDDYLLSLADSLQLAQQRLYQNRILSTDGQPAMVYQIPKLEFELKMTLEIEQQVNEDGQSKPVIKGAPVTNLTSTKRQVAEAASTIRGSFLAVPREGGKPPPVVSISLLKGGGKAGNTGRGDKVTVHVQSAVGADQENVKVEFNVNRDLSREWSKRNNITLSWFESKPAQAQAVIQDGEVVRITLTDPGKGYAVPPLVEINKNKNQEGNLSIKAKAKAVIDEKNETIRDIVIEKAGKGYSHTHPPKVVFSSPKDDEGNAIKIPKVDAYFEKGVVYTNEKGIAVNSLIFDGLFPQGSSIAAVIDVLGKTETIVFTP